MPDPPPADGACGPVLAADSGGTSGAAPASTDADAPFREVLEALASGSARAVRAFVPSGGTVVLSTHVCRKPIYGVGTCRDERAEVDRQRVRDEPLGPWQELFARAVAADSAFDVGGLEVSCVDSGGTFDCRTTVTFGEDVCRGALSALVSGALRPAGTGWTLVSLDYEEDILLCD